MGLNRVNERVDRTERCDRINSMTERETLLQAIATLQAQRPLLGDAVVEAALAPLREKLAMLAAEGEVEEQRKQVTVLFADLAGFTEMSEVLDAEEISDIINLLWQKLDAIILEHGGTIDKHIGDAVMAVWGVVAAQENDPERAIQAALEMQQVFVDPVPVRAVVRERLSGLRMRIGLNTGSVLLGNIGSTHEFTAMGDTVNVAARLEQAAPLGGVLISQDTYRHVRGIFQVQAQPLLSVKGKSHPLQTYLVTGIRPAEFRVRTRGVEGVETRLVGRAAELQRLRQAYAEVLTGGRLRMVTIVAEAGVGKSRLLSEFDAWVQAQAEPVVAFRGRASQEMQTVPYALMRNLISHAFQIYDSDALQVVYDKLAVGLSDETNYRASLLARLLGFDADVGHWAEDARQLRDRAVQYLSDCFKTLAAESPLLLWLEDLHWADDSSLDVLEQLLRALSAHRVLIVGAARPVLFERRAHWAAGAFHACLQLPPLSAEESHALVADILQKVEDLPLSLRELLVQTAEGNPFYLEELIKMFLEDGVIVKQPQAWQVNAERLAGVRVPPTLTAVLQARVDLLSGQEKMTLQRASVIGRTFWAEALQFLEGSLSSGRDPLQALLALRQREMVFLQPESAFATTDEYIFKHALLRDTVYESVLKRQRRAYHARVADWLLKHCGTREGEFLGLIADHLERSGQVELAIQYLVRAGENGFATYAYREAAEYFARALDLLSADSEECIALFVKSGRAHWYLGEYGRAQELLQAGVQMGKRYGDDGSCADALCDLGGIERKYGNWAAARACLNESLNLARKQGDAVRIAHALYGLAWVDIRQGDYPAARALLFESRTLYQAAGERRGLADALNGLGSVALNLEAYEEARTLYRESLALCRELDDQPGASAALVNLGETARRQGDYRSAQQFYEASLEIDRQIGDELLEAMTLGNLGHTAQACGEYLAAEQYYRSGLKTAVAIESVPDMLDGLAGLAGVLARTGRQEAAREVLGVVLHHPALEEESRLIAEQALAILLPQQVEASPQELKALVKSVLATALPA